MKENLYTIKTISLRILWIALLLSPSLSKSQVTKTIVPAGKGELAEYLWQTGEEQWKISMIKTLATDEAGLTQFLNFNQEEYYKDRGTFFKDVTDGFISALSNAWLGEG